MAGGVFFVLAAAAARGRAEAARPAPEWLVAVIPALVALGLTDSMTGWGRAGHRRRPAAGFSCGRFDYWRSWPCLCAVWPWPSGNSATRSFTARGSFSARRPVTARFVALRDPQHQPAPHRGSHPGFGSAQQLPVLTARSITRTPQQIPDEDHRDGHPGRRGVYRRAVAMFARLWGAVAAPGRGACPRRAVIPPARRTLGADRDPGDEHARLQNKRTSRWARCSRGFGIALAAAMDLPAVTAGRRPRSSAAITRTGRRRFPGAPAPSRPIRSRLTVCVVDGNDPTMAGEGTGPHIAKNHSVWNSHLALWRGALAGDAP